MLLARQGKKILSTRNLYSTKYLLNVNPTRKNLSSVFNDAQIIGNIKSSDRYKQSIDLSFEKSEIAYKLKIVILHIAYI